MRESALSIERDMRREWGEAAMLHPEAFDQALVVEVRKVGSDGRPQRAVFVRGTFGPQVSEHDFYPISCCDPPYERDGAEVRKAKHEPDCRYQEFTLALLDASGGVVTYPPEAQT